MLLTPLTERALTVAARLHDGQYRKGATAPPFITHPVTVASTVSRYTDDEGVVAAALLHDTLEDTDYTPEALRRDFGERIERIVLGVTIPEAVDESSWTADRRRYIENLRAAPDESALVAAADKLHNFTSAVAEYSDDPAAFAKDFDGVHKDRTLVYGTIVADVIPRIPEQLGRDLERAWGAYKTLLESAVI